MNELYEQIVIDAIKAEISDIHIQVKSKGKILLRKSGILTFYKDISKENGKKLINYIRYISKIDINYRNKPQTGHILFLYQNKKYNLRISSLTGKEVETLVIRILNNHPSLDINILTYLEDVRIFLNEIVIHDSGLFVISGATGSGKSTTLYTLLDTISQKFHKNIITLEDPVEIDKEYCLQIELNEHQGITYEESLKQILRHDPDIIMIGEIRDEKTAQLALTCALTGHLVLTTIHASHCINTLKRLENLGIKRLDLEDVLIGIMTQKMKYDSNGNHVVLAEFMTQDDINYYFCHHQLNYFDFQKAEKKIQDLGIIYER